MHSMNEVSEEVLGHNPDMYFFNITWTNVCIVPMLTQMKFCLGLWTDTQYQSSSTCLV
jgi:hypothetical protein